MQHNSSDGPDELATERVDTTIARGAVVTRDGRLHAPPSTRVGPARARCPENR